MAIANNASMSGLNQVGKPLISVCLSVAAERRQGRDGGCLSSLPQLIRYQTLVIILDPNRVRWLKLRPTRATTLLVSTDIGFTSEPVAYYSYATDLMSVVSQPF